MDMSIFEQLKTIETGSILYKVFAMEAPGVEEQHIANIVTESQLVTSKWGDEKMFFRHQRFDDDLRYHPEWMTSDLQSFPEN